MKCFILLAVVCATIGFSEQAWTKEQALEMFNKMTKDCAAKEGGTATDLEEALARKPPSTTNGKCMRACVLEGAGIMKDNKASVDGYVGLAKMAFDNDVAKTQTATEIANACATITDPNRCEAAFKVLQCGEEAAKAHGVDLCFSEW